MVRVMSYLYIVVPAALALFSLGTEDFDPYSLLVLALLGCRMENNGGDNEERSELCPVRLDEGVKLLRKGETNLGIQRMADRFLFPRLL